MLTKTVASGLGILLLFMPCLAGQDGNNQRAKHRPKIGLALEGGGALGLAHVGLIKWFEQHHIPIDYVAGTSMGGLVGGFYASGMSGPEMEQRVDKLNWDRLVGGEPDYRKLSFRRKQDLRDLGDATLLGLRHGLVLPAGLNSGEGLNLLLSEVALPYGVMKKFDDLPTPFRCVAADLVTAKAYVFEKGSFGEALRSTMSIPTLFEPVLDGNHEFVDGGFLNNLPVDVVKSMGADIVIAIYLATESFDPKKPQSAVDVLSRSLSAVTVANERHNVEAADLVISVDLTSPDFDVLTFSKYKEIIAKGFEGGEKRRAVLSKFAVDDETWAEFVKARQSRRRTKLPVVQFVEIRGIEGDEAEQVHTYFADQIGNPVDAGEVEARINRVMGARAFAYMAYQLAERDGRQGLTIYVHPSTNRPPIFQPAILLDGSDYRNTRFAFRARLTAVNFGGFRSEWRNDVTFGSAYGVRSEYFRPFNSATNWFVAPHAVALSIPLDFYRRSRILALYRQREAGGGVDFGYQFGNTGELRFGYETNYQAIASTIENTSSYPVFRGRYGAAGLSYAFDRVNDEIVPHSGVLFRSAFRWIDSNPGSREELPVVEGTASYFYPLSEKSTLFESIEGGALIGRKNSGLPLFLLGGPDRLSAYGMNELFGNRYILNRAGFLKQLNARAPITDGRLYFLADFETAKMYDFRASSALPMDVNGGFLMRTPLGALLIGASTGDAGHRKWYFQLGRVF
jgi:NTE family protein